MLYTLMLLIYGTNMLGNGIYEPAIAARHLTHAQCVQLSHTKLPDPGKGNKIVRIDCLEETPGKYWSYVPDPGTDNFRPKQENATSTPGK